VHSVKGKEPTIDFDNARISKMEPARVDKTKVRILLEGAKSKGMAYAYVKDGVKQDVFAYLVSDKRCLGKTLNEVLNLEVSF
jgi:hypothetical protein